MKRKSIEFHKQTPLYRDLWFPINNPADWLTKTVYFVIFHTLAYVFLTLLFVVGGLINCLDQNSQIRMVVRRPAPSPPSGNRDSQPSVINVWSSSVSGAEVAALSWEDGSGRWSWGWCLDGSAEWLTPGSCGCTH